MRELFVSAVAARRIARARRFLSERKPDEPILIVCAHPTSAMAVLRMCTGDAGASFGRDVTTLPALATHLAAAELSSRGVSAIGPAGLEAITAHAVASLGEDGLGRFARIADRPGLPRALANSIHELTLAGVERASVSTLDPELARILEACAERMAERALIDRGELLAAGARACESRHPLLGRPLLLLDAPVWHRAEGVFVSALLSRSECVLVTAAEGDERTHARLADSCTRVDDDGETATLWDGALTRLQSHLFVGRARRGELGDEVRLLSAPGEGRECIEIARQLLHEAERGTPFDRMAVLLRNPAHYRAHLEEALRRARIPACFAEGGTRPDPAGRALLALLACRAEDLSARAFSEYLSLHAAPAVGTAEAAVPWAPPAESMYAGEAYADVNVDVDAHEHEHEHEHVDVDVDVDVDQHERALVHAPRRWERLLVDAAVIGGRERWRRRLGGLRASLQIERARREQEDDTAVGGIERDLRALDGLEAFALPLLDALQALPERASWGEWLAALAALAGRALAKPERVLSVLSELSPMAELGPVELSEVRRVLGPRLSDLGTPPDTRRAGKVLVAPIEHARGASFQLVCIPGLAETLFPEKVSEDPILLDAVRRALSPELAVTDDRVTTERLALRLAVGAAEGRLVLSYPRIDTGRGRPRVPSFYGLEVLRAAEGRLPSYDELMRRAEAEAGARLGWPAPASALDAIDAAEHDLAVLQELLTAPPDRTRGAVHYLLGANPHLARALRFRARRWWVKRFTMADGLVEPDEGALAALDARRLSRTPSSPTALETYAACPYRFYLRAVQRLSPLSAPSPIEQLDARERGALIHAVQFGTLGALRDAGLLPLSEARLQEAERVLETTLASVAAELHDRLAPAVERVWHDGVDAIAVDLRQWLRGLSASPWQPEAFELGFGLGSRPGLDPESAPEPVTVLGARLRGAIDLVERQGDRLRATDHKTGKLRAPEGLCVDGGRTLQPVLYALALEQLRPGMVVEAGRLHHCTADGGFTERVVPLDDSARAAAGHVLGAIDGALERGFLPAAPAPEACSLCDYRTVCGPYEEQRTRRKDKKALQALVELRGLP